MNPIKNIKKYKNEEDTVVIKKESANMYTFDFSNSQFPLSTKQTFVKLCRVAKLPMLTPNDRISSDYCVRIPSSLLS